MHQITKCIHSFFLGDIYHRIHVLRKPETVSKENQEKPQDYECKGEIIGQKISLALCASLCMCECECARTRAQRPLLFSGKHRGLMQCCHQHVSLYFSLSLLSVSS